MKKDIQILRGKIPFIILIVLFHLVGLTGFLVPPFQQIFKMLVPFHLLLMLSLMIMSQDQKNSSFWLFLIVCYLAGFFVELAGIQTGLIFGHYAYGATLGYKIAGTPLMIGVNWVLVIYSAGMLVHKFCRTSNLVSAGLGAILVTLLDFIIEPVAVRFDYWSWRDAQIPLQNYLGWFFLAFFLLWMFFKLPFRKGNSAAEILFVTQFIFFLVLLLF